MDQLKQTVEQINEGLTVQSEYDILPVYMDGQLANGAAYAAFRFKRFAQSAGRFTTEMAAQTASMTAAAIGHVARYGGTGSFGEV